MLWRVVEGRRWVAAYRKMWALPMRRPRVSLVSVAGMISMMLVMLAMSSLPTMMWLPVMRWPPPMVVLVSNDCTIQFVTYMACFREDGAHQAFETVAILDIIDFAGCVMLDNGSLLFVDKILQFSKLRLQPLKLNYILRNILLRNIEGMVVLMLRLVVDIVDWVDERRVLEIKDLRLPCLLEQRCETYIVHRSPINNCNDEVQRLPFRASTDVYAVEGP